MDSKVDKDFTLVLPNDFPAYIKKIEGLVRYADISIKNPRVDKPKIGLEEFADLKADLLKYKNMIDDYLRYAEFKKNDHRMELTDLRDKLDGRLWLLEGPIADLFIQLKSKYI